MRASSFHQRVQSEVIRRGIALREVAVVCGILLCIAVFLLSQIGSARETARGNTCRCRFRSLAVALFNYQTTHGHYPGYMNALECADGTPFVDEKTGQVTPVSWVVMILPDIDRRKLFDQWRGVKPVVADPTATALEGPAPSLRLYVEHFVCPSDQAMFKSGMVPINYVLNTGMPDAPSAIVDANDLDGGMPRDWAANGVFFDNFSEHPLIKPDVKARGPMVVTTDRGIRDPKDRTILLTENVDATDYVFDGTRQAADGWRRVEMETGCIWQPGKIDATQKSPTMAPPVPSLALNSDMGKGDGKSFNYTRPSSQHPQAINIAFVGQNVQAMRDTVSYFVYCKLMASDDANVALPGRHKGSNDPTDDAIDIAFRTYRLTDDDINP